MCGIRDSFIYKTKFCIIWNQPVLTRKYKTFSSLLLRILDCSADQFSRISMPATGRDMQVQTFRKVGGYSYASTMCIGNLRSGTAALSVYCREKRPEQLKQALYYFGIIFFFAIGAGGGGNLSMRLGIPAIWVSDVLLLISFILMFSSKHRD